MHIGEYAEYVFSERLTKNEMLMRSEKKQRFALSVLSLCAKYEKNSREKI